MVIYHFPLANSAIYEVPVADGQIHRRLIFLPQEIAICILIKYVAWRSYLRKCEHWQEPPQEKKIKTLEEVLLVTIYLEFYN